MECVGPPPPSQVTVRSPCALPRLKGIHHPSNRYPRPSSRSEPIVRRGKSHSRPRGFSDRFYSAKPPHQGSAACGRNPINLTISGYPIRSCHNLTCVAKSPTPPLPLGIGEPHCSARDYTASRTMKPSNKSAFRLAYPMCVIVFGVVLILTKRGSYGDTAPELRGPLVVLSESSCAGLVFGA